VARLLVTNWGLNRAGRTAFNSLQEGFEAEAGVKKSTKTAKDIPLRMRFADRICELLPADRDLSEVLRSSQKDCREAEQSSTERNRGELRRAATIFTETKACAFSYFDFSKKLRGRFSCFGGCALWLDWSVVALAVT
jgi:hypothetical protein